MNILAQAGLSTIFASVMATLVVSYPEPADVLRMVEPSWDAPDLIAAANAAELSLIPAREGITPVLQASIQPVDLIERLRHCADNLDNFTPEHLRNCYAMYERAKAAVSDLTPDGEAERIEELNTVIHLFQSQVCRYVWVQFSEPEDEPPACITDGVVL